MKYSTFLTTCCLSMAALPFFFLSADEKALPEEMQKIMHQPKYDHAIWGLYVKDLQTGKILYDLNSNKLFSPASTTKLLTVAALLNAFGDDYRFKTPIYAQGAIKDGKLDGNLILVAQGDLTLGGRQPNANTIAFTKMDHIIANDVPGAILTKEDPLAAINSFAKQLYDHGIREINGDILIDDTLFESTTKRGMDISPIMINENLIDLTLNPTTAGRVAKLAWRPIVPGYTVNNQVKTVSKGEPLAIEISSDDSGQHITLKGTIPLGEKDIVRTSNISNPKAFARQALIQALKTQGIKLNLPEDKSAKPELPTSYENLEQVALWVSPPLSEYGKLILKVSHNLGANLVPLLLATQKGDKTFDNGMRLIGDFAINTIKLSPDAFVLIDGAGGNENRLTPQGEVQLLEHMHQLKPEQFKAYMTALPILGVDGSMEDFAKNTQAVGKVFTKPGTGVALNLSTGKTFLITQALGGYIEGKNGHLYAYMLVVNNGTMPTVDDIYAIFEDESQLSSMIYDHTKDN